MKEAHNNILYRKILHLDLDAFFCAVEEQRDPTLRGKAFAVGGRPESRGVVASCSYPARQLGIRSAMPMMQAVRRCPHLIIVPANHSAYGETSRKVMRLLRDLTPLVEQISIDEAFLDVTDLDGTGEEIARRLQQSIRRDLDLPCSLGVATNKLVAKIANNVGKSQGRKANQGAAPPNAIQVVAPDEEAEFLSPLPCEELWGVGPKTAHELRGLGLHTIGDIARWPPSALADRFGKLGQSLSKRARGIDKRPVETERESKSVSQETTFARDVSDGTKLRQTLRRQSEGISASLRRQNLAGVTIKLKIRWSDFTTLSRQITQAEPTNDPDRIYEAACSLFERVWPDREPVRLVGVGVSGFAEPTAHQMSLWELEEIIRDEERKSEQEKRLDQALAELRRRFGKRAVRKASDLK